MKYNDYAKIMDLCLRYDELNDSERDRLGKYLLEIAAMATCSRKLTTKLGWERVAEVRQEGILTVLNKLAEKDYYWESPIHCIRWLKKVCKNVAVRYAYPTLNSAPKQWMLNNTMTFTDFDNDAIYNLCYGDDFADQEEVLEEHLGGNIENGHCEEDLCRQAEC